MVVLAAAGQTLWLCGLVVFLIGTEWLDGFLARRMKLASATGARLDTIADGVFYSCLLLSVIIARPEVVQQEFGWRRHDHRLRQLLAEQTAAGSTFQRQLRQFGDRAADRVDHWG